MNAQRFISTKWKVLFAAWAVIVSLLLIAAWWQHRQYTRARAIEVARAYVEQHYGSPAEFEFEIERYSGGWTVFVYSSPKQVNNGSLQVIIEVTDQGEIVLVI